MVFKKNNYYVKYIWHILFLNSLFLIYCDIAKAGGANSSNDSAATCLLIDNNNKIVCGGFIVTSATNAHFALVRYLSNGALDPSFNLNGIVDTYINNGSNGQGSLINAIVLDQNNKYVVAGGASYTPPNYTRTALDIQTGLVPENFVIARYNQNGSLDTTFNKSGIVQFNPNIGLSESICNTLAIDANNKIVVGGFSALLGPTTHDPLTIARLNEDGSLDTSFNKFGVRPGILNINLNKYINAPSSVDINQIIIGPNKVGNLTDIIAAGYIETGVGIAWLLVKITEDGILDKTFGPNQDGVVITTIRGYDVARTVQFGEFYDLIVAGNASNGFLVAGDIHKELVAVMAVAKYGYNGILYSSFGNKGITTTDITNSTDRITAIAIDPNYNIIAAGYTSRFLAYETPLLEPSGDNFTILKYNGSTGALDLSFGTNGITAVNIINQYPTENNIFAYTAYPAAPYGIVLDQDKSIVVTGFSSSRIEKDLTTMRFTLNGFLDPTFAQPMGTSGIIQPGVVITFVSIVLGYTSLYNLQGFEISRDYSFLLGSRAPNTLKNLIQTDTIPAPTINAAFNGLVTNNSNPFVSGTAMPDSKINIYINGVPIAQTTAAHDGNWSIILPHLIDGTYTIYADSINPIHGLSKPSQTLKFTVKTKNNKKKNNKSKKKAANPVNQTKSVKNSKQITIQPTKQQPPKQKIIPVPTKTTKINSNKKITVLINNVKHKNRLIKGNNSRLLNIKVPAGYLKNTGKPNQVSIATGKTIQKLHINKPIK